MPMSPPCRGLKDKTLLVSSSGQATWWPWLKAQYQLSDAQVRPYTFNIQPFVVDDAVAQQAYVSSEVFQAEGRSEGELLPLFRARLSPYGGILIARPDTIAERKAAMAKFVPRLNGGLGELISRIRRRAMR